MKKIYRTLFSVAIRWNVLPAESGRISSAQALQHFEEADVAEPRPTRASAESVGGTRWTLKLKPGWSVVPGARQSDSQLQLSVSP